MGVFTDQMWDHASRDLEGEQRELARTAALEEARPIMAALASAADDADADHCLALAAEAIQRIADRRRYPAADLRADLKRRWKLLDEAYASVQPKQAAADEEPDMADLAYFHALGHLTARAAVDNPALPLAACQQLAEEALAKTADTAYPLAYENFGNTPDGPITNRIKNFSPPGLKPGAPSAPPTPGDPAIDGPDGQTGMFPEPQRVTPPSVPAPPAAPAAPAAPNQPTLF